MVREPVDREDAGTARLVAVVEAYARSVYPAVLEQHAAGWVSSPLGVWLLLAACATGARGAELSALERVLGCSASEASELLERFMLAPPRALAAAIAVWVRAEDATPAFSTWVGGLPAVLETGAIPSQAQADEWARLRSMGLIERFPLSVDALTRIVLASALATKVSWRVPFELVSADRYLGESSPWRGELQQVLHDRHPPPMAAIVDTRTAGLVVVHSATAVEDLDVISISADPAIPRDVVLEAAHEVIAQQRDRPLASLGCSLFDLPLAAGHSWEISEQAVATHTAGERIERIAAVTMPAWHIESKLALKRSPIFGATTALEVMRSMVGPRPGDQTDAQQVTVASFTRYGFEAAAVTGFAVRASLPAPPRETGIERAAMLRFDHPYAVIATAGTPAANNGALQTDARFAGLPLFTAWVATPCEADQETAQRAS